jgi:glucosamine-6-phosphate deaminase
MGIIKNKIIKYKPPGSFEETRFEKLHNVIYNNSDVGSISIANSIAQLIREKQSQKKNCVLGLATGSSPLSVYRELIRMHKTESLSFKNVITFNLDEYLSITKEDINSYNYFMNINLFNHIDIPKENINIPNGELSFVKVSKSCNDFEKKIKEVGGIDLQILGIGRTGHIGFNEPGSHFNSQTRSVKLDDITRFDTAKSFQGIENVPREAITMGIQTIFNSKRIILIAWGSNKAQILKKAIEGKITSLIPTSYLQHHKNTTLVLDKEASSELTRIKTPWLAGTYEWTLENSAKAVIWLCEKTGKSILKLTDNDYKENGMVDLLSISGSSYDLNIKMFNKLQHTITGWPGGKPNSDDSKRPERSSPNPKKVLIFSPHPDDDVISMGGTFDRLVSQENIVNVAYQTSGNIAVSNEDASKFLEVTHDMFSDEIKKDYKKITSKFKSKGSNNSDPNIIRKLKSSIRKRESLGATRYIGIPDNQVHFLNLPFYETGTVSKNPISIKDIEITIDLIKRIKPHQIYAAGDLADPHGTHRVCLELIFKAIKSLKKESFMKNCWVWLYRGAWHEWEIHEIDMAVPMSPDQVLRKRNAIFYHQSQKDGVMFQGNDHREFWVRAEQRNAETAIKYRNLGLSDYEAIEAFKRHHF